MIIDGLLSLLQGFGNLQWTNGVMILVGCALLYVGIKKDMEPLLLIPIGFGAILVNIPLAGLMEKEGLLRYFYEAGVLTEIFPCLIFIGIGAMTDFAPFWKIPASFFWAGRGNSGFFSLFCWPWFWDSPNWKLWPLGSSGLATGPPPFT